VTRKLFIFASDGFIAVEICNVVSLKQERYFYIHETAAISYGISRRIAKIFRKLISFLPIAFGEKKVGRNWFFAINLDICVTNLSVKNLEKMRNFEEN
jgi:hypothetical protein